MAVPSPMKSSISTLTQNTLTLIFFPFPSAPVLSVVINSTSEMCFSGSADSTIICWSIPSLDIDPYGPYRKFSKYSIYLFIYITYYFFPFFFWHFIRLHMLSCISAFGKSGVGALNGGGGGRSLTSSFSFDKLK